MASTFLTGIISVIAFLALAAARPGKSLFDKK